MFKVEYYNRGILSHSQTFTSKAAAVTAIRTFKADAFSRGNHGMRALLISSPC